jgi:hypothetical protein
MRVVIADDNLLMREGIAALVWRAGIEVVGEAVEAGTALQILAERPDGLGYLPKDRVTDYEDFGRTVRRVAVGGAPPSRMGFRPT